MTNEANGCPPDGKQLLRFTKCKAPFDVKFNVGVTEHTAASGYPGGVNIVHPCAGFSVGAGYQSWDDAVAAMRAGEILLGPGPRVGRSTFDLSVFCEVVTKAGLRWAVYPDETGRVAVGLPEKIELARERWARVFPPTIASFMRDAFGGDTAEQTVAKLNDQLVHREPVGEPQGSAEERPSDVGQKPRPSEA